MATADEGRPGAPRPGIPGWVFLAALLIYTIAIHHGVGPSPDRLSLQWYEPRTFLFECPALGPLLETPQRALLGFGIPALLLAVGVFSAGRSAIAGALAASCVAATLLLVFYGVVAPRVWQFFGWRGSAVIGTTALCVGFAAAAPLLANSWLRLGWVLRTAVYLPFVFGVLAFVRNATGTDPSLRFSISPWPAVPVFGIEAAALFIAVWLVGIALGVGGIPPARARSRRAATAALVGGIVLGVGLPVLLLWIGSGLGLFAFKVGARTLVGVAVACAVAIPLVAIIRVRGREDALRLRVHRIAVGAALIGIPVVVAQALARFDYYVTREHRARDIIDALERYVEREELYPDTLDELVAAGELASIPEPTIGFSFLYDADFRYQNLGTSYILEFPAPRWVECAYTPPYEDDYEDEEDLDDEPEEWEKYTGAGGSDGESLGEAWSCPMNPPELW